MADPVSAILIGSAFGSFARSLFGGGRSRILTPEEFGALARSSPGRGLPGSGRRPAEPRDPFDSPIPPVSAIPPVPPIPPTDPGPVGPTPPAPEPTPPAPEPLPPAPSLRPGDIPLQTPVQGFVPTAPLAGEALRRVLIQIGRVILGTTIGASIFGPFPPQPDRDEDEDPVQPIPRPDIAKRIIRLPELAEIIVGRQRRTARTTQPREPLPEIVEIPPPTVPRRETAPAPRPVQTPAPPVPAPSFPLPSPPARPPIPALLRTAVAVATGAALSRALQRTIRTGTAPRVDLPGTRPTEPLPQPPAPSPPIPAPPPVIEPTPTLPGQLLPALSPSQLSQATRTRQKRCVEVKRKRRRNRCFEGFYREFPGRTQFTDWREVDCLTRRPVPAGISKIRDIARI